MITSKDKAKLALIKKLVQDTKGQFFTVTFLRKKPKKVDGVLHHFATITGRTGVKKHLKGGESTIKHKDDLIGIWASDDRKDYRAFSGLLVKNITFSGNSFDFDEKRVLELGEILKTAK